jgi:hypothetical protein
MPIVYKSFQVNTSTTSYSIYDDYAQTDNSYSRLINNSIIEYDSTDNVTYFSTDGIYCNGLYKGINSENNVVSLKQIQMMQKLKINLMIQVKSRVNLVRNVNENEKVAIETLREMITESEFRKYIKYGFILVIGQSKRIYQIFRNSWHIKVWYKGQLEEEICVRIKDTNVPPTDNLIAFKTMIEADEDEIRTLGNVYNMRKAA